MWCAVRIGFVSDVAFPWVVGGVERTQYDEMVELSKRHDVYSFSLRFGGMRRHFTKDGIDYIGVADASKEELYTRDGRRSIGVALRFARSLEREMDRYDLDMVYANSFPYMHIPVLKRYCIRHSSRLVLDVAELWNLEEWIDYLGRIRGMAAYHYMRRAVLGADRYNANSSSTKDRLVGIGIRASEIDVFSPVLNMRLLRRCRRIRGSNTVLFAGRLIREKRIDRWIDMVSDAHSMLPKVNGLIIGSGPDLARIRRILSDRELDFIRVIPPIPERVGLYKRIAGAAVLLQTSEREGLSSIVLESMALGTPVILPDYTPIPREVRGMCVVRSPGDIPKAITEIVGSRNRSRFIRGAAGLERFDLSGVNRYFDGLRKRFGID